MQAEVIELSTSEGENRGTLLWVTGGTPGNLELVTTAAREFELGARFCKYEEAFDVLRAERCRLVGIELPAGADRAVPVLQKFLKGMPHVRVLAASGDSSVEMIRGVLEAGASDFVSLPLNQPELHKALIKLARTGGKAAPGEAGDVIAVYGVRGGLGTTTLAVNLAFRIAARNGSEVALLDLDLQRGDVAAFLNLTPVDSLATLAKARGQVDEAFLRTVLAPQRGGVFVLPAPPDIEEADAVGHGELDLALRLLRNEFPYTVIDTARTITGATVTAWEHSDRILLLTDLTVPGIRSARRAIELLSRLNIPSRRAEVVVTRAVPGPLSVREATRALGKEPYLVIPRDENAAGDAMNNGTPLDGGRSGLSRAVDDLAAQLVGTGSSRNHSGHFFQRFFTRKGRGHR